MGELLSHLEASDLKGAVFHQAYSTVVPQDPLAILLPLNAGDGVAHDVAVQLSGGARS